MNKYFNLILSIKCLIQICLYGFNYFVLCTSVMCFNCTSHHPNVVYCLLQNLPHFQRFLQPNQALSQILQKLFQLISSFFFQLLFFLAFVLLLGYLLGDIHVPSVDVVRPVPSLLSDEQRHFLPQFPHTIWHGKAFLGQPLSPIDRFTSETGFQNMQLSQT